MDENTKEEKMIEPINVNVEIDYDKLATAIVKAQEKASGDMEEKFTKGTFSILTAWVLYIIGVLGFITALYAFGYGIYYTAYILEWIDNVHIISNIFICGFIVIIALCIGLLSFMLFKSGNEIQKSKDKNFIVAVFSALSGFIALVVALVALFK